MTPLKIFFILLTTVTYCEAANILVVIPFSGKSHYVSQRDIGLELAKKGHEVTVITSNRENDPPANYKEVFVSRINFFDQLEDKSLKIVFNWSKLNFIEYKRIMYELGVFFTEHALNSTEVQQLISGQNKFDLVIAEVFYQEAMFMLAHLYKAPLVLVQTYGNSLRTNFYTKNPLQLSTVVHEYGSVSNPGSFGARLKNLYLFLVDIGLYKFWYLGKQESLVSKYYKNLPQPQPSLEDLTSNAALVLMNSHFSVDTPAAYLPNVIEIGGINIKPSTIKLPQDLQDYLDNAKEGVVFMSLGSNVKSSQMDPAKRDAFIKVFRTLKQKVIWKWEETELPGIPSNVLIRDWLPQKEILEHPNIKLFIAHGGQIGLHEALFNGLPVLGIPIFGDQHNNILQTMQYGYGEMLEYSDINEENLKTLVHKLLEDKTYYENAQAVSRRFKDRPMSGLDTALWWIEYVIRHKNADFFKSPARQLNLIEYSMLDVYFFLTFVIVASVYIVYKVVSTVKTLYGKSDKKKSKKH